MAIYWAILIIPVLLGITKIHSDKYLSLIQWSVYGVLLSLLIGLRHEVGGDWDNYMYNNYMYVSLGGVEFLDLFSPQYMVEDIGFLIVHWFSMNFSSLGIYLTNFIMSIIFVSGLFRICRMMPIPWLALVVAIPYLVTVVSMGYTRQSAAIGFIMWGLADLLSGNKGKFYLSIFIAILFHKAAIVWVPIAMLVKFNHRSYRKLDFLVLMISILGLFFLLTRIEHLIYYYITHQYFESTGSFVRISINTLAAFIFFFYRKKWILEYKDANILTILAIVSIVMLPLSLLSSTAADRLSLYLIPIQMIVFSRIPRLIVDERIRALFIFLVVIFYIAVLFVWLNFGIFSKFWIPYNNFIFL
jgi:hypothetical protein